MKTLENVIQLNLLAVDFKGTSFDDNNDCVIAKAVKRQLNQNYVSEHIDTVFIGENETEYTHEYYGLRSYGADQTLVNLTTSPDQVIRTITLTKQI